MGKVEYFMPLRGPKSFVEKAWHFLHPNNSEGLLTEAEKAESYLSSLSVIDRMHVEEILGLTRELQQKLGNTRIAVIAVGSSTKPEDQRDHPIRDIDLRILNSAEPKSEERKEVVDKIRDTIKLYLGLKVIPFEEHDHTVENRLVQSGLDSKGPLVPYVDWYNNDPSLTTKQDQGLPLHISVSGVNNFALGRHLEWERKNKSSTTVVLQR